MEQVIEVSSGKQSIPPEHQKILKDMEKYEIKNLADLVKVLLQKPEWLEFLRSIILTHDLIEFPKVFQEFLEKEFEPLKQDVKVLKDKTEKIEQDVAVVKEDVKVLKEKTERIEQDVEVLKQDVGVLKQDVGVLKQDVAVLKQDVAVLKQDVAVLKQDVAVLKQDVAVLKQDMKYLKGEVGRLKGHDFERRIREKYYAYFGRLLKKSKLISFEVLQESLEEAVEVGLITEDEADEIRWLDLLISGIIKSNQKEVLLGVEVSYSIYEEDISRASRRSDILATLFKKEVIPTIVGVEISEELMKSAEERGVLVIKVSDD
jgi:cell division protein FtsB